MTDKMKKIISMMVIALFAITGNITAQTKEDNSLNKVDLGVHNCKQESNAAKCNKHGSDKCHHADKSQNCSVSDCKGACKENHSNGNKPDSKKCSGTDCRNGKMNKTPVKDCPMMKG